MRWAKSWHTPLRWRSTSITGVVIDRMAVEALGAAVEEQEVESEPENDPDEWN